MNLLSELLFCFVFVVEDLPFTSTFVVVSQKDMTWLMDKSFWDITAGAKRGVTVSMSASLACHQWYCAGSRLAWGLNLRAVVCGIFWSSLPGVFSGYSGFPLSISLLVQSIKKAQINAISTLSNLIAELSFCTAWHITRHVAPDERSMCCTWFALACTRATWAYVLETVRCAVRRL